jgi:hypothetical protein
MTDDEALSKDDTLSALREDVLRLPTTLIASPAQTFPLLVSRQAVLQLLTKYFRS